MTSDRPHELEGPEDATDALDTEPPDALAGSPKDVEGVGEAMFADMLTRYVNPEVERRVASGERDPDALVFAFQVLFPDDAPPAVRLDREIGGEMEVIAAREVSKGDEISAHDFKGVTEYRPAERDAGIPHVTAFAHREGWSLVFEFAGGDPSRHSVYERGVDFLETARDALDGGRLGPFLDNSFSATELLATAELLSCRPTVDLILNSSTHRTLHTTYNLWGNLDNTDPRFPRLLNRLAGLRKPGRYLSRDIPVDKAEARNIMVELDAMAEHVGLVVAERGGAKSDGSPSRFNVYATRDLTAGQPITPSDYSLTPPR